MGIDSPPPVILRLFALDPDAVMRPFVAIAFAALVFAAVPAFAEPEVARPVVNLVEKQGYAVTEVKRTWLGRILITARSDDYLREVVLNRATGRIIRDQVFPLSDQATPETAEQDMSKDPGDGVGGVIDGVTGAVDGATGGDVSGGGTGADGTGAGGAGGGVGGVGGGVGGIGQ